MKVKILGTAACEGVPAMYCNCEVCVNARKLGGKNLRARTQTLINNDLLIDFNNDTYMNGQRFGIDLSAIKYYLITHTHLDHFAPFDLCNLPDAKDRTVDKTYLLGNYDVKEYFVRLLGEKRAEKMFNNFIEFIELKAFEKTNIGDYSIIPLNAYHKKDSYIYIIEYYEKTILYCLDTGKLPQEDFDFMSKYDKIFDLILIDCTYGKVEADKYGGHLSLYDGVNQIAKMKDASVVGEKTKVVLTHFSHWHIPDSHEGMEKLASEFNYAVSYDGMEVEL